MCVRMSIGVYYPWKGALNLPRPHMSTNSLDLSSHTGLGASYRLCDVCEPLIEFLHKLPIKWPWTYQAGYTTSWLRQILAHTCIESDEWVWGHLTAYAMHEHTWFKCWDMLDRTSHNITIAWARTHLIQNMVLTGEGSWPPLEYLDL